MRPYFRERLDHVPAATGLEPASVAQKRAEGVLIDANQADQEDDDDLPRPVETGSARPARSWWVSGGRRGSRGRLDLEPAHQITGQIAPATG